MLDNLRNKTYQFLRWSEKYTKTDMLYLTHGMSWLSTGQFFSSVSVFILAILFANLLPQETYGTYKFVLSWFSILAIPTLGGMGIAIVNATARGFDKTIHVALRTKIIWGLFGSFASLIFSGYYFFNDNIVLAISFLIVAFFIPTMESYGIFNYFLQGKKKFGASTRYFVISQLISMASIVSAILLTNNIVIILLAYFIPWTITRYVFYKISTKKYSQNEKIEYSAITYGKHLSLMSIIGTVAGQLDKLLIFHFIGAVELAIYTIAIAPVEQIKAVFKSIATLLLPKYSNQSLEKIRSGINKKMLITGAVLLIIIILYIIFIPFVFKLLFPKYISSVLLSQVFALSLISAMAIFPNNALQALEAKKELYKMRTAVSSIQILFLIAGIYFFGIMGIVLARIFTRLFELLLASFFLKRKQE